MNIQMERKIFLEISPQSTILTKQAMLEQQATGKVDVKCPKCNGTLKITTTSKGERTMISCPCGYIRSGEINF